ncbi:MAG: histidine--tRNA ligase [Gammaproteobacteria bacterium]|nr:histidine--tRNA ligase [Gammaproteobacteria bacterium]
MSSTMQSVRGMNDILPPESARWHALEKTLRRIVEQYGFQEVRLPIVEQTAVFARSIGDLTDIVQKEMYTFSDRNGELLSLRPEGTAGCVRAMLEHGLINQLSQRVWYQGAMFRHERPQKGRYRQFYQFGVEAFGFAGPDIDAELIQMTARMWRDLGIKDVELQINTLGTPPEREAYRDELRKYFAAHSEQLDEDSRTRLEHNPLRILDSKNPAMQDLIANAPRLTEHLGADSQAHFQGMQALLESAGIGFVHNTRLVRGLDYYTHTVFEWVTDRLGAQGTVCAGGRYDGMVAQFGGKSTPGIGFAMGMERLLAMLEDQPAPPAPAGIYVMPLGETTLLEANALTERLRDYFPDLPVLCNLGGGSAKAQMKRADRSGARIGLLIGEDEQLERTVTVRFLRDDRAQQTVPLTALQALLQAEFGQTSAL